MSVLNEPEPAGGQSSAVGVDAPIGTAKWLNSDKFIVVPPGGAGISRGSWGVGHASAGVNWFWLVGPKAVPADCQSQNFRVVCVLTPV